MLRLLLPNAAQASSCLARLKFLQPAALTAILSPPLLGLLIVRDLLPALVTASDCFPTISAACQGLPHLGLNRASSEGFIRSFPRPSYPGVAQGMHREAPAEPPQSPTQLPSLAEIVLPSAVACLCRHNLISQVTTPHILVYMQALRCFLNVPMLMLEW